MSTQPAEERNRYIVLLDPAATPATSPEYVYGPFDNRDQAEQFAEFLTREVDPAAVHQLRDPTTELLNFWTQQHNGCSNAAPGCLPPHPGINITTTANDDDDVNKV